MIPRYAPEWTNHNPSDPGHHADRARGLDDRSVDLSAQPGSGQELRRVPEPARHQAPAAARGQALIRFALVEGSQKQRVPRGTQISTPQATEEHTVTFETARDAVVSQAKPDRCFSYFDERTPRTAATSIRSPARPTQPFEVFAGAQRIERFLYLSDPRFANTGEASLLRVFLGTPERGSRDLARLLEWEYWEGTRWKELEPAHDRGRSRRGRVPRPAALRADDGEPHRGPVDARPARRGAGVARGHRDRHDPRARRGRRRGPPADAGVREPRQQRVPHARPRQEHLSVRQGAEGRLHPLPRVRRAAADRRRVHLDRDAARRLERDPAAEPVGPARARVRVLGRQALAAPRPLGAARRAARAPATSSASTTTPRRCRSRARSASAARRTWRRSRSTASPSAGSAIRIEKGDYGEQGTYTLENEKWVFKDDRPLRPPALRSITFRYREDYRDVRHVLAFNDFQFTDVTEVARTEFTIFQPFQAKPEESPALYLGFAGKPPNDPIAIYFQLEEELGLGSLPTDEAEVATHRARQVRDDAPAVVGERPARRVGVLGRPRVGAAVGRRRDPGLHELRVRVLHRARRLGDVEQVHRGAVLAPRAARAGRLRQAAAHAHDRHQRDRRVQPGDDPRRDARQLGWLAAAAVQVPARPAARRRGHRGPRAAEARPPRRSPISGPTPCAPSSPRTRRTTRSGCADKRVDSFFASGPRSRHYTLDYVTGVDRVRRRPARHGAARGQEQHRRVDRTGSAAARSATSTRTR